MPDSPASLQRKIGSAADLQSVVRAMKAQAAASITQSQRSVVALSNYASAVEAGLGLCLRQDALLQPQGEARALMALPVAARSDFRRAVVFGSDLGLVGRFNDIVAEQAIHALAALPGKTSVWAVGERVRSGLERSGMPVLGVFESPGSVQAIGSLVERILIEVVKDATDTGLAIEDIELHLFYNRSGVAASYAPADQRLLPLGDAWRTELQGRGWPGSRLPEVSGGLPMTLRALVREYLFVSIFRAGAESLASENASRLASMERADRNIDKMLQALRGRFHRLRQSRIDEELSDVIAGFTALAG